MIGLIDADFIPFISAYDKPNEHGEVVEKTEEEAIAYCDYLVSNIFKDTKCTEYIMALTKGKCFRYKIYPEYKGNRKYKQELKHLKTIKQYLIDKYKAVFYEGLEADDIINICKSQYGNDSFIISPDKDLLMLEGVSYNPKSKEWNTSSKYQYDKAFATSMISGDTADNIKGVKGKGKSYANKVLKDKFTTIDLLKTVFESYLCNYKSLDIAIDEFYTNFKCLYIVDTYNGFSVPKPIPIVSNTDYDVKKTMAEG